MSRIPGAALGSLFEDEPVKPIAEGAVILRGFAVEEAPAIMEAIHAIEQAAPFRHMVTPGGGRMSAAMTNCGSRGWVTDRKGYRYATKDPMTGKPWTSMPALFLDLADRAAMAAGFPGFVPDGCLINRYEPGARMGLHQDKDEKDRIAPIVSVSLGLPVTFLFGGATRRDKPAKHTLAHGDVAVWGGPARFTYHGVAPLEDGEHPLTGRYRFNLTLRKAL
jgi:alkylated DNA repair protein (DNA oxidative demethylase)